MSLKPYPILLLLCVFVSALSCGDDEPSGTGVDMPQDEWTLVFEDEFDGNLSQWNVWNAGAFNEEIQLYGESQLSMNNGILSINTTRESVTGATHPWDSSPKQFEYVSGRIETNMHFGPSDAEGEREYRFMARIKLPAGHGMWPAFWSYGDPWPTQGEIDILEARGGDPTHFQSNLFFGTQANVNINSGTEQEYNPGPDLTAGFHTYEMIWRENTIEILFDDQLLHTYNASATNNVANMFGKEQRVVLNTAVGGLFFGDRNSANYADGAIMEVDWVRVYRK